MSVQSLANLIAEIVNGKQNNHAVIPAIYYGSYAEVDGRNYKCDVAVDIELDEGEECYVMIDDSGTTAVVVGK